MLILHQQMFVDSKRKVFSQPRYDFDYIEALSSFPNVDFSSIINSHLIDFPSNTRFSIQFHHTSHAAKRVSLIVLRKLGGSIINKRLRCSFIYAIIQRVHLTLLPPTTQKIDEQSAQYFETSFRLMCVDDFYLHKAYAGYLF